MGSTVIQWIKLFYNEQNAEIQYDGHRSHKFSIWCGVQQGCPLSPLLFLIVREMLNKVIKKCSNIHGACIETVQHKMILYADNITLFLQHPTVESLTALNLIISLFSLASGFKINESKIYFNGVGYFKRSKGIDNQTPQLNGKIRAYDILALRSLHQ